MTAYIGVLFALTALVAWGCGDFLIQRTTRLIGDWKALFFIGVTGLIVLFPFVYQEFGNIKAEDLTILCILGLVMIIAPIIDFEALKEGKMSIIEPIIGLELPITAVLAALFAHEVLGGTEWFLITLVFIGIVLAVTTNLEHVKYHRRIFERGASLAFLAALGMAATNFLIGESTDAVSPLMVVWVFCLFRTVACSIYLLITGNASHLLRDFSKHPLTILGQSVLDNVAWLSFAFAVMYLPIAITTTISGGYVVLAVLLGITITKEKLRPHQYVGIVCAIIGISVLSYLYG